MASVVAVVWTTATGIIDAVLTVPQDAVANQGGTGLSVTEFPLGTAVDPATQKINTTTFAIEPKTAVVGPDSLTLDADGVDIVTFTFPLGTKLLHNGVDLDTESATSYVFSTTTLGEHLFEMTPPVGYAEEDYTITAEPEAEYTALIARMTDKPSEPYASAMNKLWADLKAAGFITGRDYLYVWGSHDQDEALLDWLDNVGNATLVNPGQITFRAGLGFKTRKVGSTYSYLAIPYDPATNGVGWTQNNASFGLYVLDSGRSDAVLTSSSKAEFYAGGTHKASLTLRSLQSKLGYQHNSGSVGSVDNPNASGLFVVTRNASGTVTVYRESVALVSGAAQTSTGLPSVDIRIGESDRDRTYGAVFGGAHMSATMVADVSAAFETYFAAIGASQRVNSLVGGEPDGDAPGYGGLNFEVVYQNGNQVLDESGEVPITGPSLMFSGDSDVFVGIADDSVGTTDKKITIAAGEEDSVGVAAPALILYGHSSSDPFAGRAILDAPDDNVEFYAQKVNAYATDGLETDVKFIAPVGSAGAPSYTFAGDTDTGMYRAAANEIGWATAGTAKARLFTGGQLRIGPATAIMDTFTVSNEEGVQLTEATIRAARNGAAAMLLKRYGGAGTLWEAYNGTVKGGEMTISNTTLAIVNASDERLKTNIRDLPKGMARAVIDGLKPRLFDWNGETSDEQDVVGFVAGEMKTVAPECVSPMAKPRKQRVVKEMRPVVREYTIKGEDGTVSKGSATFSEEIELVVEEVDESAPETLGTNPLPLLPYIIGDAQETHAELLELRQLVQALQTQVQDLTQRALPTPTAKR